MKISVFGTGYAGLINGKCFTEVEHDAVYVHMGAVNIDNLNKCILPIWEIELQFILERNAAEGRRCFTDLHRMAAVPCSRLS